MHSRKAALSALGFFALIVVIAVVGIALSASSVANNGTGNGKTASTSKQVITTYPQGQIPVGKTVVAYPPGGKAITPYLNAIPSYTTGDVRQYILTSGLDQTTTSGTPATITKIAFMTANEASTLLQGESIGRPDGALVCYVELRGPFTIEGPVPAGAILPTAQKAYDIFDAQTGNILMWGYFIK